MVGTELWNSTIIGTGFEVTAGTLVEAVLIFIAAIFTGRLLRRLIIRASKTTGLTWIINQDTGDILFRMFVLGGIIGAL